MLTTNVIISGEVVGSSIDLPLEIGSTCSIGDASSHDSVLLTLKRLRSNFFCVKIQWTLSNSNSQGEFEFVRIMESSD